MTEHAENQPTANSPDGAPEASTWLPNDPAGAASPDDRPEVAVGAAFAGGFALALILRRLAR